MISYIIKRNVPDPGNIRLLTTQHDMMKINDAIILASMITVLYKDNPSF